MGISLAMECQERLEARAALTGCHPRFCAEGHHRVGEVDRTPASSCSPSLCVDGARILRMMSTWRGNFVLAGVIRAVAPHANDRRQYPEKESASLEATEA
jgi:hypothetical protein